MTKHGCGQFRIFIRKDSTINKEDGHKYEAMHISWGTTTSWEPPSLSMTLCVMTKAVIYSSDWFRYKVGSTLSREVDRVECIFINPNFHIRRQITPNSRVLS
ncbi:hypothetical protein AVEN_248460-1 [Araneus ventricosus]|uniref:Uncharacterized protein n=1 Tax=Araneus ventricosus TaxID=182803 RepID=A0A4Y2JI72_ARAVE|nr:hypothetical protein AVEN_240543-1 [Araneus ventricosus]GBM89132.1 hypothetical protein AVEN_248460-1 [Araneus ventricosus]